jgi:hypothetical protein
MPSSPPRKFQIKYRLKTGNNGSQRMIIEASSSGTARQIFEQQNPGCVFEGCVEMR